MVVGDWAARGEDLRGTWVDEMAKDEHVVKLDSAHRFVARAIKSLLWTRKK